MTNVNESSAKLNENLEALKHNFLSRILQKIRKRKRKEQKK
jgi:phospholipid/cholesterol/gamma-HCH transport system substrate-binding protein